MSYTRKLRTLTTLAEQAGRKVGYTILKSGALLLSKPRAPRKPVNIYPSSLSPSDWVFHTEEWSRVIHRWADRAALKAGQPVLREENTQEASGRLTWCSQTAFSVNVSGGQEDRWVYTYLDPQLVSLDDFEWHFKATRFSEFQELQFGFRYINFYNRYRIRHERGHICVDLVRNGVFYNNLSSRPFVMHLGQSYCFVLKMIGKRFWLFVDGKLIFEEYDFLNTFPRGSVAFILWESKDSPEINAKIEDIRLFHA